MKGVERGARGVERGVRGVERERSGTRGEKSRTWGGCKIWDESSIPEIGWCGYRFLYFVKPTYLVPIVESA